MPGGGIMPGGPMPGGPNMPGGGGPPGKLQQRQACSNKQCNKMSAAPQAAEGQHNNIACWLAKSRRCEQGRQGA